MLRRNIIANYLGQFWTVLIGIALIPLYINYLGLSSFGLIGLFTLISTILGLLDQGLKSTLSREMARFTGGENTTQYVRELLRSIEVVIFFIATLIIILIHSFSDLIALSWIESSELSTETISSSVSVMGFVVGLRLIQYIYSSCISGLQKQVLLNGVLIFVETLRGFGAIIVLAFISPTISAFFIWQAVVTFFGVIILCISTYKILPECKKKISYSSEAIKSVWGYSKGVLGITFLALILTQADKILLINLLTLSEYGLYTFAAIVANIIFFSISPITNAFFPKFSEQVVLNNKDSINESYHLSAQLVSVFAGSIALVLATFSNEFLIAWTQDNELTNQASKLLTLLVLGNLLNGLMWVPYQMQLAHGWTSLSIKVNASALILIIPSLLYFVPLYGVTAAAWIWIVLNISYILVPIHIMHRKILVGEQWSWFFKDTLFPLLAGTMTVLLFSYFSPDIQSLPLKILYLVLVGFSVLVASVLCASRIRSLTLSSIKLFFIKRINFKNS